MLTLPINRIAVILSRASNVEPADVVAGDLAALEGQSDGEADETFGNPPARQALIEALAELTPDETRELLALAEMAELDDSAESWNSAVQRAQAIATEDAIDRLLRALVLTDAIEVGLGRLGYDLHAGHKAKPARKALKAKRSKKTAKRKATSKAKRRS